MCSSYACHSSNASAAEQNFYVLHKANHHVFWSRTSFILFFCSMVRFCIGQMHYSGVISRASDAVRSHLNRPASSLLYTSRNPFPSHKSSLIQSVRLPQNRKRQPFWNRSNEKWLWTVFARPSMPKRRSAIPIGQMNLAVQSHLVKHEPAPPSLLRCSLL